MRVHTANATGNAQLDAGLAREPQRLAMESRGHRRRHRAARGLFAVIDRLFRVQVAEDAVPTAPFFTRPSTEQPYYDIIEPGVAGALLCALSAGGVGGVHL